VVHDAHPDVLRFAHYRTAHPGGHGAVREICDLFDTIIRKTRT
jgi:3-deoxy-D-manno-octulosonate 8-phosphate phosphatase KdsC-like HAD superfamily phosphatase